MATNYTHLAPRKLGAFSLMILGEKKGQRGAGRGLYLLLFAVGFDSTKSTDDAMIAEFGEGIGAQTIIAGVIGKAGLAVDFQVDVKVGEFVFAILKQLGVMLDGFG